MGTGKASGARVAHAEASTISVAVACRTGVGENLARGDEDGDLADVNDESGDAGFTGRPSSADATDLLDLVRGAEEDARVSASSPDLLGLREGAPEQFVDVGDEAVDLPPSLPPMRSGEPMSSSERIPISPPTPRMSSAPARPRPAAPAPPENDDGAAMHPALAIVLIVGAVVAALYGLLSLPSLL